MKHVISVMAASCVILLVLASGCADITAKQKVGDFGTAFGTSSDEQKAIDWFKTKYGDPLTNNDQPARFLEPLITTGLSTNNMPVDKVTTFPVSGGSVYFFVIYDNFKKGDPITVSWVYMENGREVTKVEKQAGGDFGRFIVEFQKPDSGWGKGRQKITVSGGGTSADVTFTIGDALQTSALPYNTGGAEGTGTLGRKTIETPVGRLSKSSGDTGTGIGKNPSSGNTNSGSPTTVDIKTDVNNCGKIGNVCPEVLNAKKRCNVGYCLYSCISPYDYDNHGLDAPIDPKVGCTFKTDTDPKNCGAVGRVCPSGQNAKPGCYQETCTLTCNDNYRNCGTSENVNCVSMYNDPNYCGSCGKKCGSGQYCDQARCVDSVNQAGKQSQPADSVSQSQGNAGQGQSGSGVDPCIGFSCPTLFHCDSNTGYPVCMLDADACNKLPCPLGFHCDPNTGYPVCCPPLMHATKDNIIGEIPVCVPNTPW